MGYGNAIKFRDNESIEGVVPNDLLSLFDRGVQMRCPLICMERL